MGGRVAVARRVRLGGGVGPPGGTGCGAGWWGGPLRALRNDALLAATAVSYDATVLTANVKDFELLGRFLGVRYRAPV